MQKQAVAVAAIVSCLLLLAAQNIGEYEGFTLALQWPLAVKKIIITAPVPSDYYFTIHGLWPNYANASRQPFGPYFCRNAPEFNNTDLLPIEQEMINSWPSIKDDNYYFWKYEWDKHGSCSVDNSLLSTVTKYFNETLNLYKQVNVLNILARSAIVPSSNVYTIQQVKDAFVLARGFAPIVTCSYNKTSNVSVLTELHICYDRNLQPAACSAPTEKANGCSKSFVKIPPVPSIPQPEPASPAPANSTSVPKEKLSDAAKTTLIVSITVTSVIAGLILVLFILLGTVMVVTAIKDQMNPKFSKLKNDSSKLELRTHNERLLSEENEA